MKLRVFLAAATIVGMAIGASQAETPQPVELKPMKHRQAELVVVGADGQEMAYDPAGLETLPTYRMVTATPWREEPAAFDGVLLTDLLEQHGLSDAPAIVVTAENDYQVTIAREAWNDVQILVATRVNDRPHSRRARGPIQFVIGQENFQESEIANDNLLVWMAARIEAAQ